MSGAYDFVDTIDGVEYGVIFGKRFASGARRCLFVPSDESEPFVALVHVAGTDGSYAVPCDDCLKDAA